MLGLLPPFPTRLVSAIIDREKVENDRLGREINISSLTSMIRTMIYQDKSLHRFIDIEEGALQERISLVLERDEVKCNKCSKRCDSDDEKCLFCDCLGNYCGSCSPTNGCPNYPDCKCGCEACIPESDEEPDEVCEPDYTSMVKDDLESKKHLSADEILLDFIKEEKYGKYGIGFLSGIYLDCFNKTFPLNVTFMADEFSTEYSSTAMALIKGHLLMMNEELRRKTIEKLNNTFSAYWLALNLDRYIQVKATIEA